MSRINSTFKALAFTAAALAGSGTALACGKFMPPDIAMEKPSKPGLAADYVGLTVAAAQERAVSEGRLFRVVSIDGEPQMTTRDFRVGRANADVVDGVVTAVYFEGEPSS